MASISITVTIVDFNSMSSAIDRYHKTVDNISQIIQAYQTIMNGLRAAQVFTGAAATVMIEAIQQYINALNEALENLNELIEALQEKLDKYEEAHQEAQNIANSAIEVTWQEV